MNRAHRRGRALLAGMLLAASPCALALNPALDASQYAHTSWKIRDGFSKGEIVAIAQTADGYLWLGSEFGLLRFDGVRSVPWERPGDQPLPSSIIFSLLASRDGTLWIGTAKGLASWKNGKLTVYPELREMYVFAILQDREGVIWASGLSATTGRLCAIRNGSVQQCAGDDGALGHGSFTLFEDSNGILWVPVKDGVWRLKPGTPKFYRLEGEPDGIQAIGQDDDGALLVGWNGGLWRLVDGKTETYPIARSAGQFRARRIFRDRDSGLWIGTSDRGLLHVHQGRTDVFAAPDGLSSPHVYRIFEDREGNIWVSTTAGLDRFRDFPVSTLSVNQGLSNASVVSVLAARDGSVWLATRGGLSKWMQGQITNYTRQRTEFLMGRGERIRNLNELTPIALFQDDRARIWVATLHGFGYLENDRFIPISGVPASAVTGIAQDKGGSLWVANENAGLLQLRGDSLIQQVPWSKLADAAHASALAADPSQSGVWVGFHNGGIAYFNGSQVRASYNSTGGLGAGRVNHLRFDRSGALWAATYGGLSRLKNGRLATLSTSNGLACDTVHWTIEDDADAFWLYTACGLLRIARSDLVAWAAAADKGTASQLRIQFTTFDASDGVRILAGAGHFYGQVAKSNDGKLWFLPGDGASIVDPRHLSFNKLAPPVHIEQITADRRKYNLAAVAGGRLSLPSQIRDLQIEYTALSLAAPEKVRFRYLLEGYDQDWHEADTRRQAFYTNLPPRNYRFRVRACNNSGVWNEAGAALDFSIDPAYYQTTWFGLACVAGILALLAGVYQLRMRYLKQQFNLRLETRVGERTRIARDLHDTLLQSFQGVLMKFSAVTYMIPDRPAEAQQTLEAVIEQSRQAIAEAREAVQGLRSSMVITNDLARSIGAIGESLAADHARKNATKFNVEVEGTTKDLAPLVRDDIYQIACEAVRNAFLHAAAGRIEVEIHYEKRQFRLCVRDDGKGIDPKLLGAGARDGHYGLPGMRERAKLVGGKLAVWSKVDDGTEVELTIPGNLAYAKSADAPPLRAAQN